MLKSSLLILSCILLLSSCTSNSSNTTVTPVSENTPVSESSSSDTVFNVSNTNNTTPSSNVSSVSNTGDLNGNTSTSSVASVSTIVPSTSADTMKSLSTDTKSLIELQNEKGPNAILEVNCSKYDTEGKKFCTSQQALIKKANEETITWEETLKKGPEYIKTFDCKKINNEFGQKYCLEYQISIAK